MFSIKLPTSAGLILLGYFTLMLTGIAIMLLGLYMHTGASMIAGSLLGMYVGLLFPQFWAHLTAYPTQVYKVEWLFMGIALIPVPIWLYAMFFCQLSDDHAVRLVFPAITLYLATLLPSPKHPQERVPVWQRPRAS
jgi:hypothetical protein